MSEEMDTCTRDTTVYVRLLDEGTEVSRPVVAHELSRGVVRLCSMPNYGTNNERWEFPPGSLVHCENTILEGRSVLLATKLVQKDESAR